MTLSSSPSLWVVMMPEKREFSGPKSDGRAVRDFLIQRNPQATRPDVLHDWSVWWKIEYWNPYGFGWAPYGYLAKPIGEAFVGGTETGND